MKGIVHSVQKEYGSETLMVKLCLLSNWNPVRIWTDPPNYWPVAQLVERNAVNVDVIGSMPVWSAKLSLC